MGFDVWVAKNDRSKSFNGQSFGSIKSLRQSLTRQADDATARTIELIDVLWLQGNDIQAAFEVESTTSIFSGLLRMSDLIAMHRNLNIPLYIVAPAERRGKVMAEVNRPTFRALRPPMTEVCRFIPFEALRARFEGSQDVLRYLRPEFLDAVSETTKIPRL